MMLAYGILWLVLGRIVLFRKDFLPPSSGKISVSRSSGQHISPSLPWEPQIPQN